jgi:hypothetical protein
VGDDRSRRRPGRHQPFLIEARTPGCTVAKLEGRS